MKTDAIYSISTMPSRIASLIPGAIGTGAEAIGATIVAKPMLAIGDAMIDNPLVAIPVSTGLGIVANNLVGNPIGGVIDAVTGNNWDLKSDLDPNSPEYQRAVLEKNRLLQLGTKTDAEMKAANENFKARYGRDMTPEEYYRIQNELQKRRNSAMQRAKMIEYQQEAMEDYRR